MSKINYKYIAVEGNIGAGKTTLAKFLSAQLNGSLLLEEFEDNQFLKAFYSGEDFALHAELQFILDRSKQMAEFFNNTRKLVFSDYVPQKSLIFSKINLNEKEFKSVKSLTNLLYKPFQEPDLVIFIERDVEDLIENIYKRGRVFEQSIDEKYIESIMNGYDQWLKELKQPVLRIKAKQIDMRKPVKLTQAFSSILRGNYSKNEIEINLHQLMKAVK